jgi:hypothetical protein
MSYHFQHPKQLFISSLLVLMGAYSCGPSKPGSNLAEYGPVFSTIMLTDAGTLRGFNLGDKLDTVKSQEIAELTEADDAYLYYEAEIDTTGTYNLSYTFDENGLSEMQSDIFINNADHTDAVFNQFKNYFDKHYGPGESHNGFDVWTIPSEKYGKVRINLSDDSGSLTTDKAPGKISLWIYPDKE